MSKISLLHIKAFRELEQQLEEITPEDVAHMGWAYEAPVCALVVGEAPFHLRALHLLHDRVNTKLLAATELYEASSPTERSLELLNTIARLQWEVDALEAIFGWVFQSEFPPPPCTERVRPTQTGIGHRGEAYYNLVRVNLDGDAEPVERRRSLH